MRRYVASRRPKPSEIYVQLAFAPGEEAQVDWGEASVIVNGRERKVQLFCVRLLEVIDSNGVGVSTMPNARLR